MSVSTEVQRTLVKSPPELWTELSNPEALARHLGDFGEVRITNAEPETKVEWEAEQASGIVQLKQSGWGTKVTLSVTRNPAIPAQPPAPEPATAVEPDPVAAGEAAQEMVAEPEPEPVAAAEPEPAAAAEPEPIAAAEPKPVSVVEPKPVSVVEPKPVSVVEPEPVAADPEPVSPSEPETTPRLVEHEPQLGFFARLFRRRKAKPAAVVEPEPQVVARAAPEPVEVVALAAPEPVYPACLSPDVGNPLTGDPPTQPEAAEPAEDLASELESLEEQMAAETTELLTGVLDRLGAAHHRPFSRG